MGKEHGGEEADDGDEDGKEKGERTLALDCGERHETGDIGGGHNVCGCCLTKRLKERTTDNVLIRW